MERNLYETKIESTDFTLVSILEVIVQNGPSFTFEDIENMSLKLADVARTSDFSTLTTKVYIKQDIEEKEGGEYTIEAENRIKYIRFPKISPKAVQNCLYFLSNKGDTVQNELDLEQLRFDMTLESL